jgi:hypothetical protein
MASVHSGFSLSIISGSGFFFIAFHLRFVGAFVGAAQADNPHRRTMSNLEVHHGELRSHSGADSEENLITLCTVCHAKVHRH